MGNAFEQVLKKASGFIPAVQAIHGNRQGIELASRSFRFRFSISSPFTPIMPRMTCTAKVVAYRKADTLT